MMCSYSKGNFQGQKGLIWEFSSIYTNISEFDLIECFTTTFLRAHSWLNWVNEDDDEDEVGLKEKPEDTRYIKKITSKSDPKHRECGQKN